MSGLLLAVAVEDAALDEIIGVKEAVVMALEHLGRDVRVLRVEVREEEQMRMKEE